MLSKSVHVKVLDSFHHFQRIYKKYPQQPIFFLFFAVRIKNYINSSPLCLDLLSNAFVFSYIGFLCPCKQTWCRKKAKWHVESPYKYILFLYAHVLCPVFFLLLAVREDLHRDYVFESGWFRSGTEWIHKEIICRVQTWQPSSWGNPNVSTETQKRAADPLQLQQW